MICLLQDFISNGFFLKFSDALNSLKVWRILRDLGAFNEKWSDLYKAMLLSKVLNISNELIVRYVCEGVLDLRREIVVQINLLWLAEFCMMRL